MKRWNFGLLLGAPALMAVALWYGAAASPLLRGDARLPLLLAPIGIAAASALMAMLLSFRAPEPLAPIRWPLDQ